MMPLLCRHACALLHTNLRESKLVSLVAIIASSHAETQVSRSTNACWMEGDSI